MPRLGRQFQPIAHNVAIDAINPTPNSIRVSCNSVGGGNPIIGVYAPLSLDYRVGEPFYLLFGLAIEQSASGPDRRGTTRRTRRIPELPHLAQE